MKNNVKIIISITLVLVFVLCFAACSSNNGKKIDIGGNNPASKTTGIEKFVDEHGVVLEESFEKGFTKKLEDDNSKNPLTSEKEDYSDICTITVEKENNRKTVLVINCKLVEEIAVKPQEQLKKYIETDDFKELSALKNIPDLTAIKIAVENKVGQLIAERTIEVENLTTE